MYYPCIMKCVNVKVTSLFKIALYRLQAVHSGNPSTALMVSLAEKLGHRADRAVSAIEYSKSADGGGAYNMEVALRHYFGATAERMREVGSCGEDPLASQRLRAAVKIFVNFKEYDPPPQRAVLVFPSIPETWRR